MYHPVAGIVPGCDVDGAMQHHSSASRFILTFLVPETKQHVLTYFKTGNEITFTKQKRSTKLWPV